MASKLHAVSDEETQAETPAEGPTMSDDEIRAAIQAEFQSRQARQPRQVSIVELFQQGVALIASATGKDQTARGPRVSEQTAVRLYELTLMWALQNRNQGGGIPSVIADNEIETEPIGSDLPTAHEIIEAVEDDASVEG